MILLKADTLEYLFYYRTIAIREIEFLKQAI